MAKEPATQASTAIEVVKSDSYAIARMGKDQVRDLVLANLGDGGISEFDMTRVNVPGAGGLSWQVPDLNGEPDQTKEIEGVILLHGNRRAYYKLSFEETGGGTPPDCSSLDGKIGIGYILGEEAGPENPPKTRHCATCPMAQWGSVNKTNPNGKKNNAQACSQRKLLFVLRKDDVLPLVIDLAPTSIKPFTQFMMRLTQKGIPSYGAVVGIGLKNDQSSGNIKYSAVNLRLIGLLDEPGKAAMQAAAEAMRPFFDRTAAAAQYDESVE